MINLDRKIIIDGQEYEWCEIRDSIELCEDKARQNKVLKIVRWTEPFFGSKLTEAVFTHELDHEVVKTYEGCLETVADFTNLYTEKELEADRNEYKEITLNSLRKVKREDLRNFGVLKSRVRNLPEYLAKDILIDLL